LSAPDGESQLISGAKADRTELGKLVKAIGPGDVVVVSRPDRLMRSTLDLLSILRRVCEANFKSLKDPWADTTTPHGKLMVTILAGLATFERHLIKARTEDGRRGAKERGVRFGRPPKLDPVPASGGFAAPRRWREPSRCGVGLRCRSCRNLPAGARPAELRAGRIERGQKFLRRNIFTESQGSSPRSS
jgi:hypothetical protein